MKRQMHGIESEQKRKTSEVRRHALKDPVFLEGRLVSLEPLSMRHFSERYLSWLNDAVVCRENRHAVFPYTSTDLKKYLESTSRYRDAVMFAICFKADGRHVGNVGLINISWIDRSLEIAILIGDKNVWGKGVGFEVCRILRDYAFERLNMHRVWMGITATNGPMIRIARKLGMKKEGCFKDALYKEGGYLDVTQWHVLNPKYH